MDLGFDSAGALRLRNKLARLGGCGDGVDSENGDLLTLPLFQWVFFFWILKLLNYPMFADPLEQDNSNIFQKIGSPLDIFVSISIICGGACHVLVEPLAIWAAMTRLG